MSALKTDNRVAIFAYHYPFAVSGPILDTARYLAERGYHVDILLDKPVFFAVEAIHPNVTVTYCTPKAGIETLDNEDLAHIASATEKDASAGEADAALPAAPMAAPEPVSPAAPEVVAEPRPPFPRLVCRWVWRETKRFFRRVKHCLRWPIHAWLVTRPVVQWAWPLIEYILGARRELGGKRYRFWVGFEPEGLIAAAVLGKLQGVRYYYHSLELREVVSFRDRVKKRLERWANRGAQFTVIQDQHRAGVLAACNQIAETSIRLLPVSHPGPPRGQRSRYLHERFGIDPDKKVILFLGGIWEQTMALEIAQETNAPAWRDDWVLFYQGFSCTPSYLQKILRSTRRDRVHLSLNFLKQKEVEELTASADIGVALYRPLNALDIRNCEYTIYSSNKIAQYFHCGLPVIVNDYAPARQLLDEFGCGVYLHEVAQLIPSIEKILARYDAYRASAQRVFVEKYEFNRNYENVLRGFAELGTGGTLPD